MKTIVAKNSVYRITYMKNAFDTGEFLVMAVNIERAIDIFRIDYFIEEILTCDRFAVEVFFEIEVASNGKGFSDV